MATEPPVFTTSLIGQDDSVQILKTVIADPPHLFFSGGYGSGKTTLMQEFLRAYYKPHGISITDPEWTLWLSSEQDRGIHCVRKSVAEFVRHSAAKPGIYRWIIVDDADSLPIISQQALRRPMETHSHSTRFIFLSRYPSDLIQPIKSRCLHLELETISPMDLVNNFSSDFGHPTLQIQPDALVVFISLTQTPTEVKAITRLLCSVYKDQTTPITREQILSLFASPSFSLCLELLQAFVWKDKESMQKIFLKIWATGISYEDFLHELTSSLHQLGVLTPLTSQEIHQIILRGWISFAQGKTNTLDLMRLFFVPE
jgi:hypothetical protein